MTFFKSLFLLFALLLLASCNTSRSEVALGEEFTLTPGERVSIGNTNIGLALNSVALEWDADLGDEFAVVEITIFEGSKKRIAAVQVGQTFRLGDFEIRVHGTDPFGTYETRFSVTLSE